MRILHYSTWKEQCGIAAYTADLVHALAAQGVEGDVHPVDKLARRYMTPGQVRTELAGFAERAAGYDLVHVQHEFSFFNDASNDLGRSMGHFLFLLRQLARQGKPVVTTFHTEPHFLVRLRSTIKAVVKHHLRSRPFIRRYLDSRQWNEGITRFFVPNGFRAIVHSRRSKLRLVESGFAPEATDVIPLGLVQRDRTATLAIPRAEAKERLGYPRDAVLLSLFGFVAAYKGPDVAVGALRALPENFYLAIVGGPHPQGNDLTLNNVLEMVAEDPRLTDRVRVTGFVTTEQLDLYHAATDICLAPYQKTDLSGSSALTWALSSGKPVIASRITAFQEVQEGNDCLLLFTEGAEYELAWQVRRLLADHAMQETLVRNALAYVERNSWPAIARTTRALYESMTGGKADPVARHQAA